MNRSSVGLGLRERFIPFLGNSKVMDWPYPWGLTDKGENMAKRTYFFF